jgi:tetratricopeptide (TPR) repeat protein
MNLLVAQGQARVVESAISGQIARSLKEYAERNGRQMGSFSIGGAMATPTPYYPQFLLNLVELYWLLDRPADVVSLFQDSPGWGVDDLANLRGFAEEPGHSSGPTARFYSAWALDKTGQKERAAEIISTLILQGSEFDPDYEVLLDARGSAAVPILEEAASRNPSIARPLLWKAVALHRAHRDQEAETVIRKAIALDPSDANASINQWQKAYSVLADIRASLGDSREASALRRQFSASALMERGDDLLEGGLTAHAISLYQEAVRVWPRSALLESKLGLELEESGASQEARKHYSLAFELLPGQLGSREPTKFGLDALFKHPIAAEVASTEFRKRLDGNRRDATTEYLEGRLELARRHDDAAMGLFIRASAKDPNYTLAWAGVAEAGRGSGLPPSVADTVLLNLARLEPDGTYFGGSCRATLDPAVIWKAVYEAPRRSFKPPAHLWRLESSAKAVAAAGPRVINPYFPSDAMSDDPNDPRQAAARAVAAMPLIGAVAGWLDYPEAAQ